MFLKSSTGKHASQLSSWSAYKRHRGREGESLPLYYYIDRIFRNSENSYIELSDYQKIQSRHKNIFENILTAKDVYDILAV